MVTIRKPAAAKNDSPQKPPPRKAVPVAAPRSASVEAAPAATTRKSATASKTAGAAAKKPAPKAPAPVKTPVAARKKTAGKKTSAAAPKANAAAAPAISPAQRANYIEVAAFYIAQRRGFAPANPTDDWLQAEAEIDGLIAQGHFGRKAGG
jgi:hypothetical protein